MKAELAFVSVGVSLSLLAGCSSTGPGHKTEDGATAIPVLPLTSLIEGDVTGNWLYAQANEQAASDCMKKKGFDYPARQMPREKNANFDFQLFGRKDLNPSLWDEKAIKREPLSDEAKKALVGDGATIDINTRDGVTTLGVSGCSGEAALAVEGGLQGMKRLVILNRDINAKRTNATTKALASPIVGELNKKWAECMSRKNFSFSNPTEIPGLLSGKPGRVDPRDVPEARADMECKSELDYLPKAYGVLAAAEQAEIDADPGLVLEYKRVREGSVANAKRILSAAGQPTS